MVSNPAVLISGATAAGKTDLVLRLAERLPIDIISVDAAQVFRRLNIGTAKPDASIRARFPHKLVDIREPQQTYSAARFRTDAIDEIESAFRRRRLPVLTGGTMFYFSALVNGLSQLPAADTETRNRILDWAEKDGWEALHRFLVEIDPGLARRIHANDRQRLQRALEINQISGRCPSEVMAESAPQKCPFPVLHFTLFQPSRARLHQRINLRFRQMLDQGLIEEVEALRREPGLTAESVSMRTVGYRQVWSYLDGKIDYNSMIDSATAATRQLAKRQLTWLRSTPGIVWLDASHPHTFDHLMLFLDSKAM